MCGIVGVLSPPDGAPLSDAAVRVMADAMTHRGPDSEGTWTCGTMGLAFGHRRLAILDLSASGAQPMHSASAQYSITYNGEIYNAPALRKELASAGARFRGTSDTEVILAACEAWGVQDAIPRLNGMFAMGIWDASTRTVTLVRDRLGEKPLYYGWIGDSFGFASELSALRRHPEWRGVIDRGALALYFRFNYVPGPYSIYEGIRKLPPGTMLEVSEKDLGARTTSEPSAYWSLAETASRPQTRFRHEREAMEQLRALLQDTIRQQSLSDVPVGALLSGGIDSSLVVALMQEQATRPVRTFTMKMDDPAYDEAAWAERIARHLGTMHTELLVTADDALRLIPSLPFIYDEPFADSSQIPTSLVARLAREHVTVCLTGDGGDETFCGYNRHVQLARVWRAMRLVPPPVRRSLGALIEAVPADVYDRVLRMNGPGLLADQVHKLGRVLRSRDIVDAYRSLASQWPESTSLVIGAPRHPLLFDRPEQWPSLASPLQALLWIESMTSLPDQMLVKVDRATMAAGLEARSPLLDPRVVEFAWSLEESLKVRDGQGKWILRRVLEQYVPRQLTDRRKQGFSIPLDRWLRGPLRDWAEALLDPARLRRDGYIDPLPVTRAWEAHVAGRAKLQARLWSVLMFQSWLDAHGHRQ